MAQRMPAGRSRLIAAIEALTSALATHPDAWQLYRDAAWPLREAASGKSTELIRVTVQHTGRYLWSTYRSGVRRP